MNQMKEIASEQDRQVTTETPEAIEPAEEAPALPEN